MGKFSSILLGTISGAAAAVFLTSKKGKEITAKVSDFMNEVKENPDDFKDYVEYYEIYDMNTGEIVKKESLANKTGIIWRYNSKTGKLEMESHLENGKIFLQKEYGEDGKIIQEYNY